MNFDLWLLSDDDAESFVRALDTMPESEFRLQVARWNKREIDTAGLELSSLSLRDKVLQIFSQYWAPALSNAELFKLDYKIGLCLYRELSPSSGFSTVAANNDDLWRYLSCKVFPDITYERYGDEKLGQGDIRINKKRFYSHRRRIWLKTLWWFVHLAWQGSFEETEKVLQSCNIDTINKLYEQPGEGFRINLCRELMRQYYFVENKSSKLFERIQKQNLVNCRNVEPALFVGGEKQYIRSLFQQLSIKVSDTYDII